jgi:fructan beta-fructosidase
MSNWQYGQQVPTKEWRSAMTVPRELSLKKENKNFLISSVPIKEMDKLSAKEFKLQNVDGSHFDLTSKAGKLKGPSKLTISSDQLQDFSITLSNSLGQKLVMGFDKGSNSYFIDRTGSGKVDFEKGFGAKHKAPRLVSTPKFNLIVVIDNASVELFADDGLIVMTEIFFPDSIFSDVVIESKDRLHLKTLQLITLRSIYK